jgi:quercetin dioxygenase-like cupin family protein
MTVKSHAQSNPKVKGLIVATCLMCLAAAGTAQAFDFVPLGEGILPSGKFVQNFQFTIYPGETVPWHYHPGQIYGVIVGGTLTEETGCGRPAESITMGSAFSERPGAIHRVFNYGTDPVKIVFTFIVPPAYAGYTGTIYVKGPRCDN